MSLNTRALAYEVAELAREYDVSVGTLVREALASFLRQRRAHEASSSQKPPREQTLSRAKARFEAALHSAASWGELEDALGADDLQLAPKGGGLVLRNAANRQEICKASELGHGYSALIRRFGAGFPGHSHTWLAERALGSEDEPLVE